MMWQSARPLAERVVKAASYYERKYGRKPNMAMAHPRWLSAERLIIHGVQVMGDRYILDSCLWIGVADDRDCDQ